MLQTVLFYHPSVLLVWRILYVTLGGSVVFGCDRYIDQPIGKGFIITTKLQNLHLSINSKWFGEREVQVQIPEMRMPTFPSLRLCMRCHFVKIRPLCFPNFPQSFF